MNLLEYLRLANFPYYLTGPLDLEVWVPPRWYHAARVSCENLRCVGTRVTLMVEEL